MGDEVDVTSEGLSDLSRALTKKRLEYVKIINMLHEPPRGVGDLVAQSREFTDRLKQLLEDGSEVSDLVRRELVDENGFPGQVYKLPLDSIYSDIAHVKEQLRIADGYQPYLVAPEAGLRNLFQKSMESLLDPVKILVESVHELVTTAVDRALKDSCQVPAVERGPAVVRFPNFIENVLPIALGALSDLKDDAMKRALQVVEMEGSFVTCSFFRYLTFKRIKEQEVRKQQALEAPRSGANGARRGTRGGESDEDSADNDEEDGQSIADTEVSTPVLPNEHLPNIYQSAESIFGFSGYLQKSSSHSRNKLAKTEMSLWQRRFFGVRDATKTLEYYATEESFLKGAQPGAIVQLADCIVSETDGQGVLPESTLSKSKEHLDAETQVSLLILIQTKDPNKNVYKNSKDLILRAENAAVKYQWLSYLRTTSLDSRSGTRVATWTSKDLSHFSSDLTVESVQAHDAQAVEDYGGIVGQGQGLGHAVFWDPLCRDQNNGLIPSPGIFVEGDQDLSMEKAIIQHAEDMKAYTKLSCETLIMTIPKVIVHCLVDRATERLGPRIEEYILGLSPEARESLLQEDAGISLHREQINDTVKRIGKSEELVKQAGRSMGQAPTVKILISVVELAGLSARLKKKEDGSYTFINKPPPPATDRNRTPERKDQSAARSLPATQSRASRPAPQRQPTGPSLSRAPTIQSTNGNASSSTRPKRPAPAAPPVAAQRQVSPSPPSNGQQPTPPQPGQGNQQQTKPPQGSSWYGFRPFGR